MRPSWGKDFDVYVRHTAADTSGAAAILGYSPAVRLEEGLRAEAEWLSSTQ